MRDGATNKGQYGYGTFDLYGGSFAAEEFQLGGRYFQTGGTNVIAGEFTCVGMFANVRLEGGLLCSQDTIVASSYAVEGFLQSGGVQVITNQLNVSGRYYPYPWWEGYKLFGGELVVSNITLYTTLFVKGGGILTQSGVLAMTTTYFHLLEGSHQFGPLRLDAGSNSTVYLPRNTNCVARFRASAAQPWEAGLTVANWTGSIAGGGTHQIIFGDNSSALTADQVTRILFLDPAGHAPGLYSASILANGEVVPSSLPPTGRTPPRLALTRTGNGVELTVSGDPGANYGVEISEDLGNWTLWTTQVATNGTMTLVDTNAAALRFYRAMLMP